MYAADRPFVRAYQIVSDVFWQGSGFWIIRDPSCIASISATPETVLNIFASVQELWNQAPFNTYKKVEMTDFAVPKQVLFAVLVRALNDTRTWDDAILQRIEAELARAEPSPVQAAARATMAKARRCLASGDARQVDSFKVQSRRFIDEMAGKAVGFGNYGTDIAKHIDDFVQVGLPRACSDAPVAALPPQPAGGGEYFAKKGPFSCEIVRQSPQPVVYLHFGDTPARGVSMDKIELYGGEYECMKAVEASQGGLICADIGRDHQYVEMYSGAGQVVGTFAVYGGAEQMRACRTSLQGAVDGWACIPNSRLEFALRSAEVVLKELICRLTLPQRLKNACGPRAYLLGSERRGRFRHRYRPLSLT